MQTLYNALINGTPEYKDNGEIIVHPPTAVMLRAAKTIKQLCDINNNNMYLIHSLQNKEAELTQLIERMKNEFIPEDLVSLI